MFVVLFSNKVSSIASGNDQKATLVSRHSWTPGNDSVEACLKNLEEETRRKPLNLLTGI